MTFASAAKAIKAQTSNSLTAVLHEQRELLANLQSAVRKGQIKHRDIRNNPAMILYLHRILELSKAVNIKKLSDRHFRKAYMRCHQRMREELSPSF